MPEEIKPKTLVAGLVGDLRRALASELAHYRAGKGPGESVPGGVAEMVASWRTRLDGLNEDAAKQLAEKRAEVAEKVDRHLADREARLAALQGGEVAMGEAPRGGALVGGRLTDKASGAPLPYAEVVLAKGSGNKRVELAKTLSDEYGIYRFELDEAGLQAAAKAGGDAVVAVLDDTGAEKVLAEKRTALSAGRADAVSIELHGASLPGSLARGELAKRALRSSREVLKRRRKALADHRGELEETARATATARAKPTAKADKPPKPKRP